MYAVKYYPGLGNLTSFSNLNRQVARFSKLDNLSVKQVTGLSTGQVAEPRYYPSPLEDLSEPINLEKMKRARYTKRMKNYN